MGHLPKFDSKSLQPQQLTPKEGVPKAVPNGFPVGHLVGHLDPADLLTPEELAQRLKVQKSWVFEQTRNRAKVRNERPLPCIRLGKYLRFSWPQVCQWMAENSR